ncbi:MAG TPA: PadR family transcriptional regulator [Terriglobales bacterium]|nr:PadR family transcriptional regulator [Terriglobales bacterium]
MSFDSMISAPPPPAAGTRLALLQGTLDLLILRTLQNQARHGWSIMERIEELSHGLLQVNQGSIYPALHRLENQGWVRAGWRISELGRRARYYTLTPAGRRQLEAETSNWQRFSAAVGWILQEG